MFNQHRSTIPQILALGLLKTLSKPNQLIILPREHFEQILKCLYPGCFQINLIAKSKTVSLEDQYSGKASFGIGPKLDNYKIMELSDILIRDENYQWCSINNNYKEWFIKHGIAYDKVKLIPNDHMF